MVPINSSGQWGTYWVHAHAGVSFKFRVSRHHFKFSIDFFFFFFDILTKGQYVDGLRAPLQIHPPTEVHSYDEEFTVILGDWYHDEHSVLIKQFINIANPGGAEPVPGQYYHHYYVVASTHFTNFIIFFFVLS